MNNLFLNFMLDNWSTEETNLYTNILDLINAVNEDYTDSIDNLIFTMSEDSTVEQISNSIRDIILDIIIDLLNNVGVFVNEKYYNDIEVLYNVYREIINIENNEQVEYCLSILESDKDDVIVFYELLRDVGSLDVNEEDFCTNISKISPFTKEKLINHFRKIIFSSNIREEEVNIDISKIANDVKNFIREVNDDSFYVINLIRNGVNLGLNFDSYIKLYGKDLFSLDIKEQCYNLYLLSMISKEGNCCPAEHIEKVLSNYIYSMSELDYIIRSVREIQIKTRLK